MMAGVRRSLAPARVARHDSAMSAVQQIQFTVRMPVTILEEGAVVIAHAPGIDVASHGATRPAAMAALVEAMQLWFMSCYERGQLDAALKDCGFTPSHEPEHTSGEMIDVHLPLAALRNVPEARAY